MGISPARVSLPSGEPSASAVGFHSHPVQVVTQGTSRGAGEEPHGALARNRTAHAVGSPEDVTHGLPGLSDRHCPAGRAMC